MMIKLIFIYKRDSFEAKIDIYYQIIGVIIKDMFKFLLVYIMVWIKTVLEKAEVENIVIMYVDGMV